MKSKCFFKGIKKKNLMVFLIPILFIFLFSSFISAFNFEEDDDQVFNFPQDNLDGHLSSFFMPLNTSVYGDFDFNGGWENGGFSIVDGNIYAQTGFFYNITSLNVTKQNLTVISDLILNGFSPGSVLFTGSNNQISEDNSNLFWDDTNTRLGVGTTTPLVKFHLDGGTPTPADEML